MIANSAAVLLAVAAVDSFPRPIKQLVHTTWTSEQGAPTDIIDLGHTTDGYLWLGTRSGLFRFDGVRFVQFSPIRPDTVPDVGVRRLLGTRDGSLWIVWLNGSVTRLRQGRVQSYGELEGLPVITVLTESHTGTLVAGGQKGLFLFSDHRWKDVSSEWRYPGTESKAIWFDPQGTLWAQTQDRLVYRPLGSDRFLDSGFRVTGRAQKADFAQDRNGRVWMAELSRSAHTVPRVGETEPISEVLVGAWTLLIDRKGSLWIGTGGDGLRRVRDPTRMASRKIAQFGGEAEQFTQKDGLLSDVVYAMLEDREGNIWVATTRGLERFREGAFAPIVTPGSIRARFVYATRDSAIWTGTQNIPGVFRLRGVRHDTIPHVASGQIVEAPSGAVWMVDGKNIFRLTSGRFIPIQAAGVKVTNPVGITADTTGTLWILDNSAGLLRLTNGTLNSIAKLPLPTWPVGDMVGDRSGRIWIAQQDRVALYDRQQLHVFGPEDGVRPNAFSKIFEDNAGGIWVVTDGGLSKFDNGRFRRLTSNQVAAGRPMYGVTQDNRGAWWIATDRDVRLLPPGELDRAIADSTHAVRFRSFGTLDGVPGRIVNVLSGHVITRGADGRIWVATDSVLASADPHDLPAASPPNVLIEVARSRGHEWQPYDTVAVPPNSHDFEIDYTATNLSMPEGVLFRYQLEGDRTWTEVGGRRRAYYSGLPPGSYRFRVSARTSDGEWNKSAAILAFSVLPDWHQTLWFRTGMVLLIGAFGAMTAALVQRRRHQRVQLALKTQYEATLAERARIAQDLHDTLLQGFAGVTLQLKTAELALPDQPDVATETLLRVQRLARESLREARERVWDMQQTDLSSDDLAAAIESLARDRAAGTNIGIAIVTKGSPRRLTRLLEDVAFRIAREAIGNAIRHANAQRIEVVLDYAQELFRLEVRDDGRGFTAEQADVARRQGHFGLSGMRTSAARVRGRCEAASQPDGGTLVRLELPL